MSLVPDDELAKLVREEPAGARDRKEEAPGVDHPAPKTAPDENELRLREAAALRSQVANYEAALRAIDAEAAALEAGTHPEFVARAAPITAARDARIARSQRAHRAQLAALDKLRDAEVQASEDEVKRRVASLEAKLAERKAAAKGEAPPEAGASRSLRSQNDGRRSPARRHGPASSLIAGELTDDQASDDLVAIATAFGGAAHRWDTRLRAPKVEAWGPGGWIDRDSQDGHRHHGSVERIASTPGEGGRVGTSPAGGGTAGRPAARPRRRGGGPEASSATATIVAAARLVVGPPVWSGPRRVDGRRALAPERRRVRQPQVVRGGSMV